MKIRAENVYLQVHDYPGSGIPVLFLHFGGGNLMMWKRVVPFFNDRNRVILIDLRGHGRSDKPETGNDIDRMAYDVVQVMEQLGIERAHIVGSSLGAEAGLSLAADFPGRAVSLVCEGALYSEFGPYGLWEGSESEFNEYMAGILEDARNAPEAFSPSLEEFVADRRKEFEKHGWWNEWVEAASRYDALRQPDGSFTAGWQRHSRVDYMEHYFMYRFEDYYRRVLCPVLMVSGENPEYSEIMENLRKLPKSAEIARIKGWIHPYGWMLDCEGACRAVLDFHQTTENIHSRSLS